MDEPEAPRYCGTCLSLQPGDAAFCLRCGADLSLPPPRALPPPSRPRLAERGDFEEMLAGLSVSRPGFDARDSGRLGVLFAGLVFWLAYKLYRVLAWLLGAAVRSVRGLRPGEPRRAGQ